MLKITVTETPTALTLVVQGRLVAPWVQELKTAWKAACQSQEGRDCVVDLDDVTFLDQSGERLLRAMLRNGTRLVAKGVYTVHVLENLEQRP